MVSPASNSAQKDTLRANERFSRIHRTSLVSVGEVFFTQHGKVGPRLQDRYELVVLRKGDMTLQIDGMQVKLGEGEAVLLKPDHREVFTFTKDIPLHHQCWCIVRPALLPASLLSRLSELALGNKIRVSNQMDTLLELALSLPARGGKAEVQFYEQLVLTIFFEFFRLARESEGGNGVFPLSLVRALRTVETNLNSQIHLHELAKLSGASSNHLIKLFRVHLNSTPMHYLWTLRIQRGAELLRSTILSVAEVSEQCGFQSAFHFSRAFKKAHGISPKQFRVKSWQSEKLAVIDEGAGKTKTARKTSPRKKKAKQ